MRYRDKDYADPRVPAMDAEINKYTVGIVPCDRARRAPIAVESGSGTCVTVGGRYFVATAAHVILKHASPDVAYHIASPSETDYLYPLRAANLRGGGPRDALDLGWLELTPEHARSLNREFLPVHRMRPRCTGNGEALAVSGAPVLYQARDTSSSDKPHLGIGHQVFQTSALCTYEDLAEQPDLSNKMYLHWPRIVTEADGGTQEHPPAPGLSGGGVWALNIDQPGWAARSIQLVGIEYSWVRVGVPDRFLRAFQIQLWLQMLAEDIPELREDVDPFLGAAVVGPTAQ